MEYHQRWRNSYFNSIRDTLNHMGHELVGLLEVLAGKQGSVVVISAKFTDDEQALGEEVLAFLGTKERGKRNKTER